MNFNIALAPTLQDILCCVRPLPEEWAARNKIIEELQDIIKSVESLRGATVEPFGSFVSNLLSQSGDLDVTIMLYNGSHISSSGKRHRQNVLDKLESVLRMKDGFRRLEFIRYARVPILKFDCSLPGVSCDVSIDNIQGLMKSKILLWIGEIDSRFRDMVLLVKEWAKAHQINNPKAGSFNSYSLSLLVIFHFQTCEPPILPPLKDIYPGNAAADLIGVRAEAERYIKEICDANISKYRFDRGRPINRCSLSELFVLFFVKLYDINSKASELGVCPFTGKWEEIRSNMRWLPKTYAIFIEDPFEQPENAARGVSATNLMKMNEAIKTTLSTLLSANQDRSSRLSALVRPHVLRNIARTTISKPNLSFGNHASLPSKAQYRVHNVRQGSQPSNSTRQGPAQQRRGQVQLEWKPK